MSIMRVNIMNPVLEAWKMHLVHLTVFKKVDIKWANNVNRSSGISWEEQKWYIQWICPCVYQSYLLLPWSILKYYVVRTVDSHKNTGTPGTK